MKLLHLPPIFDRRGRFQQMGGVLLVDHVSISANAKPDGETIRFRFSASAPLDASGDGPKWNVLIPMGEYHGPTLAPLGGKFNFTAEFFEQLVANWKANGSFRVPVRWSHEHEHNTDPAKVRDLDRKAANITDLRVTASGLEAFTNWNASGKRDVESGEFDSWSAEFRMRHLNRLTGEVGGPLLTGVGLTNDPFFNLMPPVAASAGADSTDTNPNQEQQMNPEQLKKWALSLGLSADATIDQCVACSNAKIADAEARVLASAKNVPAEVITAAVKPVQDQVIALEAKLKAEQDKGLERDVDAAIEAGKHNDGKMGRAITAELREFIMATAKSPAGIDGAKKLIAAIPASVPMTAVGHNGGGESDAKLSADAAQEKLMKTRDQILADGKGSISRSAALEKAILTNPELANAARSVAQKEN